MEMTCASYIDWLVEKLPVFNSFNGIYSDGSPVNST